MMPTILSSFFLIFSAVFVIVAIPSVRAAVIRAPPYVLNLSNGLVAYWTFDGKDTIWTPLTAACGSYTMIGQDGLTYGTVVGADGKCWLDRNLGARG